MSKYYYHGTRTINTMVRIFACNRIKSQRLLGYSKGYGYNGLDYISVCKKENTDDDYKRKTSAFCQFIKRNCCFIISDEIDAIKTEYMNCNHMSCRELQSFLEEHSDTRYSDMFDEWQVKNSIPLKYVVGIGLPIDDILERIEYDQSGFFLYDLSLLLKIVKDLNLDIIDTCEENFIENYESKNYNNEKNLQKIMEAINE